MKKIADTKTDVDGADSNCNKNAYIAFTLVQFINIRLSLMELYGLISILSGIDLKFRQII